MAKTISQLSGFDRFHTGFIFIEALNLSSLFNRHIERLKVDITSTVELIKSFYIPVNNFGKAVTKVKNLDKNYKSVCSINEVISMFYFREKTLFPALITLCNIAIQNSRYEWMGLLPLLHVIKHDSFVTSKPFTLLIDKNNVEQTLFCELKIQTYLAKLPQDKRLA